MCRIVTAFINMAFGDGRCHPVVGDYEVDSAFFGIAISVASGLSRSALTSESVIADVRPPLLIDESHGGGENSKFPLRSPMISLGPGSMLSN